MFVDSFFNPAEKLLCYINVEEKKWVPFEQLFLGFPDVTKADVIEFCLISWNTVILCMQFW